MVQFADRAGQTVWVLDHQADLDADFLAFYGIDLDTYPITGPRYLALASRLTAYQGVMAARVDGERNDTAPEPAKAPRQVAADSGEVSLTAFRVRFPGLVSMAASGEE